MELTRSRTARILFLIVLIVWAIFTLFPIYWTAVTSLKSPKDTTSDRPTFIPYVDYQPTFDPFRRIFAQGGAGMGDVGLLTRNSFVAALDSGVLAILLGTTTAYALSRFRFRRWKNNDIAFWW